MGKLEELEEELYGSDVSKIKRRIRRQRVPGGTIERPPSSWDIIGAAERQKGSRKPFLITKIIQWAIVVFLVLFILGGSGFIFFYLSTRGQEVTIEIYDHEPIESGELVTIPIVYKNVSQTSIHDVELTVLLPDGSLIQEQGIERPAPQRFLRKVDPLRPGEEGVEEIVARFFGAEGEKKKVEVILSYQPETIEASFSAKSSREFLVQYVPLAVAWDTPESAANGQDVAVRVHYSSTARTAFENLSLRIRYPDGFTFDSATPQPRIGENIWNIGTLKPAEEGVVVFRGRLEGNAEEIKTFRASLGVFDETTKEWRSYSDSTHEIIIAVTPLVVEATLNNSREQIISAGDTLRFKIFYKNNTPFPLQNVTVRSALEEDPPRDVGRGMAEFDSLQIGQGGVFDFDSRSLVWGPGNVLALRNVAPGEEGTFEFSVSLRGQPIVRDAGDTNFVIRLRSSVAAQGIPEELAGTDVTFEDTVEFKVRSKILFGGKTLFSSSPIVNTGPIPPRVGQTTQYTISWEVRNFTNDLRDVVITAPLPPNVRWENTVSPVGADISFDQAASEVRWTIGDVEAGVGILRPALIGAFQVSVTPSEADVGDVLTLVNEARMIGQDTFTEETFEEVSPALTTNVSDGGSETFQNARVVR